MASVCNLYVISVSMFNTVSDFAAWLIIWKSIYFAIVKINPDQNNAAAHPRGGQINSQLSSYLPPTKSDYIYRTRIFNA